MTYSRASNRQSAMPRAGVYELTADHKMESSVAIIRMRPFAIASVNAYDPGPPPAPDSVVAKRDLAEVKAIGARNRCDAQRRPVGCRSVLELWRGYRRPAVLPAHC